jgi:preprotein translocase subunit SecG
MWQIVLPILLFLSSAFLILLVLIQRGRGGGLAGAFGGLGGQSAFGTKAGDLFTRITIGVAAFWIILCAASVKLLNDSQTGILNQNLGKSAPRATGGAPEGLPTGSGAGTGAAAPAKTDSAAPAKTDSAAPAAGTEPSGSAPAESKSAPASGDAPGEGAKSDGGK